MSDSFSSAGAFFTSTLFTGFLTFLLLFPADCSTLLSGGCKSVFGIYAMSEASATVAAGFVGFACGGVCYLIAEAFEKRSSA